MCGINQLLAHFALIFGIGTSLLVLYVMFNPEQESLESYFFSTIFGFVLGLIWSIICTDYAWWTQLSTQQKDIYGDPCQFGRAFHWAGAPATISLLFAIMGMIAVAVIPYVHEDVNVNLYQVIPQIALIGYYVGVWLCLLHSLLCGQRNEGGNGIPPREPEPVAVEDLV
jgi:hypothetical protein